MKSNRAALFVLLSFCIFFPAGADIIVTRHKPAVVIWKAARDWEVGKYQKVRQALKQSVRQCHAGHFCGRGYLTCEHIRESLKLVDAALNNEIDPQVVRLVLWGLSTRYVAKSMRYFDRAIELNPRLAFVYKKRADMRRQTARFSSTRLSTGRSATVDGEHGDRRRVVLMLRKGAVTDYTRAIRYAPKYTAAYVGRGDVYRKLGRYSRMRRDYRRARRLNRHCGRLLPARGREIRVVF